MSHEAYFPTDVLDAIASGIVVLDAQGRVLVWNRWMERHSGIVPDAAMGHRLVELFPEIAGSRVFQAIQDALRSGMAGLITPSIHTPPLPLHKPGPRGAGDARLQQLISIAPLSMAGMAACTLHVQDVSFSVMRERKLREQARALAQGNAELRARIDDIHQLQHQIEEISAHDGLTGLYNREYLDQALPAAIDAAKASGCPLSLVMIDIDRLRDINDEWGTAAGDAVLRKLTLLIDPTLPEGAIAGRYGSDDFLVLLPGMAADESWQLADCWRKDFCQAPVALGSISLDVSFSAGVATYPGDSEEIDGLIECVSLALFLARHDGYNRVVIYDATGRNEVA